MDNDAKRTMLDLSGGAEALRLAFVVYVKMQPKAFQREFIEAYREEINTWRELASGTATPDNWIESFESRANRLVQLLEK